jgi:uncharacterized protein YdhG (YjbR/CyaY superfamily)
VARPATLATYLEGLDAGQRALIEEMRRRSRALLRGFLESFEYGMPYYRRGTGTSVGFAVRGKGLAIYAGEAVVSRIPDRLSGIDCGKGCIRLPDREKIDWELVDLVLRTVDAQPR